jgi:hypothetical protein
MEVWSGGDASPEVWLEMKVRVIACVDVCF